MLSRFIVFRRWRWRLMMLLATLVLLGGCANTWSAKVTTFQQWPADAFTARYFIEPPKDDRSVLIFQSIADNVRVALGAVGLVEGDNTSRLVVQLDYDNPMQQEWVERYADPFYDGVYPYGSVWGGVGHFGGFGGGVVFGPRLVTVPTNIYANTLEVTIRDKANHLAEIYRVRVINKSNSDDLIQVMPYLAKAAFTDFPGLNGKTQYIKIKRNHN
ncbi:MAG: DUF4136 domain-containing protein [Alcaligenaceae bacterium]|nr:DUF4136 domain-containing protein [Alcaligenaceae bacterium]